MLAGLLVRLYISYERGYIPFRSVVFLCVVVVWRVVAAAGLRRVVTVRLAWVVWAGLGAATVVVV